jgi:hypothetical protein
MVGQLIFIGVLGQLIPNVGNFEHAGGALIGAVVGFAHRKLIRLARTPWARLMGAASLVLLTWCAAAQYRAGSAEATRYRMQELADVWVKRQQASAAVDAIRAACARRAALFTAPAFAAGLEPWKDRAEILEGLKRLDQLRESIGTDANREHYRRFHDLATESTNRVLKAWELEWMNLAGLELKKDFDAEFAADAATLKRLQDRLAAQTRTAPGRPADSVHRPAGEAKPGVVPGS